MSTVRGINIHINYVGTGHFTRNKSRRNQFWQLWFFDHLYRFSDRIVRYNYKNGRKGAIGTFPSRKARYLNGFPFDSFRPTGPPFLNTHIKISIKAIGLGPEQKPVDSHKI